MTVDFNKEYTSDGIPVRILCTDKCGDYPVVAIVGEYDVSTFTLEGRYNINYSCSEDLKEVWTPKPGELCYFWDCTNHALAVRKFDRTNNTGTHIDSNGTHWGYCAPFDGNLPEGFVK
jgi:hypothetical protein